MGGVRPQPYEFRKMTYVMWVELCLPFLILIHWKQALQMVFMGSVPFCKYKQALCLRIAYNAINTFYDQSLVRFQHGYWGLC